MATFTTDGSGRLVATAGPALHIPPTQNITGSLIDAAASKTMAAQQTLSNAVKSLGAGQKGAGKRRRRTRRRGGAVNLNAQVPMLPEAGTIKGVSHETNHITAVDTLNQIRADGIYDQHINAQPYQVAGRLRKTKRKSNGGRHHRTNRRKHRKSVTHRRRKHSARK
jgi:hypothetical protein